MTLHWSLVIRRIGEQKRLDKIRTVGRYAVPHDDAEVAGLSGACAETRGRGDNSHAQNNRCVEPGVYPLATEDGHKYCTIGYTPSFNPAKLRRPSLLLTRTNKRGGVLIHPGRGSLSSVGCINPAADLQTAAADTDFVEGRTRVIAIIDDLARFLGDRFPNANGRAIPEATVTIHAVAG